MTFIITAANRVAAFQVVDTRLTDLNGNLVDDFAVKATIVHCWDGKLVMSITGLAIIGRVRTDKWITERLKRFEAWKKAFQEVMQFLRDELNECLRTDSHLGKIGLTINVIGLGYSPSRELQPAIAFISNISAPVPGSNTFAEFSPVGRLFERWIMAPPKVRHYMDIRGATGPARSIRGPMRNLQSVLKRFAATDDVQPVLDQMVAILRLHRKDPGLSGVIGSNCLGIAIKHTFESTAVSYGIDPYRVTRPNIVRPPLGQEQK